MEEKYEYCKCGHIKQEHVNTMGMENGCYHITGTDKNGIATNCRCEKFRPVELIMQKDGSCKYK